MTFKKSIITSLLVLSVIQPAFADQSQQQKAWDQYQKQCAGDIKYDKTEIKKCVDTLFDLADDNFIPAMLEAVEFLYDFDKKGDAISYLIRASDLGDPTAQTLLGSEFAHVGKVEIAKDLFEKALKSKKDFRYKDTALFNLGVLSRETQDYAKAAEYFQQAAKLDHLKSAYELGNLYRDGNGVKQDFKRAVELFRKAAEGGISDAQVNLGMRYQNGEGVPFDMNEAIKWFQRAADQGNAIAMNKLAVNYFAGRYIKQDITKGAAYMRQACKDPAAKITCEEAEETIKKVERVMKK